MSYVVKDQHGKPSLFQGHKVTAMDCVMGVEQDSFDRKERSFVGVCSVEQPDRLKDIIRVDGVDTKDYRKNPAFCAYHDYFRPPLGTSLEEWTGRKDGKKVLFFRPQFHDKSEEARLLWDLYSSKVMRAFSVGFLPVETRKIKRDENSEDKGDLLVLSNPLEFVRSALLEVSAVVIPANQDCLAEIKTLVRRGKLPQTCINGLCYLDNEELFILDDEIVADGLTKSGLEAVIRNAIRAELGKLD